MSDNVQITIDDSKLRIFMQQYPQKIEDWLSGVAEQMVTDIKLSFGTSPPGRAYQRGTVTHIASMPGYPPNVDTGSLRASIRWASEGRFTRIISDGVEYGIMLEYGTEYTGARPFVRPVFEDWRQKIAADARANLGI